MRLLTLTLSSLLDVRGFEPLAPCLQSVSQSHATESDERILSIVFFALPDLALSAEFLPIRIICYLGVHQIVQQLSRQAITGL